MDAGVAALLGAGVGLIGALAISRVERADVALRERRRAYAAYLGALYPLVAELRGMPAGRQPGGIDRIVDRVRGPDAQWVASQKAIVALGGRPHTLGDRLSAALAYVQVLDMPGDVMSAIDAANDYVERLSKERTVAAKAEWPPLYARLQSAKASLERSWRRPGWRRNGPTPAKGSHRE